jgi:hypothetical protein
VNDSTLALLIGMVLATGSCNALHFLAGGQDMDNACAKVCPSSIGEVHEDICQCGTDGGWVPLVDYISADGSCQ